MSNLRDSVLKHPLFTKTRLVSLYSDFIPLKEINPDGFEANLVAWNSLIDDLFNKELLKDSFVLDTEGLLDSLVVPGTGKPQALAFVLEQQIKNGGLIPYKQFNDSTDSIYATKWVKQFLRWTANKFVWDTSYKLSDGKTLLKPDKLISKKKLEVFSTQLTHILESHEKGASKLIFTKEQFKTYLRSQRIKLNGYDIRISDLDLEILLKYLERDVGKIKRRNNIIKFGSEQATEEDIGIAQLKSTIDTINTNISELTEKIESVNIKLRASMKNSNKELSKNLLRSKKIAEHSLNQQLASLNQLEFVIYKIDQSSTNIQLVSALEKGTYILKGLNSHIGGIERVERIMDELEEEKTKVSEIADELLRANGDIIDESEIDDEFEVILKEEQGKKNLAKEDSLSNDISDKLSKLVIIPNDIKEANPTEKEAITN